MQLRSIPLGPSAYEVAKRPTPRTSASELAELRGVLLREQEWRVREGLV
jgi:hypothetical protein